MPDLRTHPRQIDEKEPPAPDRIYAARGSTAEPRWSWPCWAVSLAQPWDPRKHRLLLVLREVTMRIHMMRFFVLLVAVAFALASSSAATAQMGTRVVEKSAQAGSIDTRIPKEPKLRPSPAPGKPAAPRGPGNYAAGCCSAPPPFPGLNCCDFSDCGWFDCNESAVRSTKKFRR